MAHEAVKEIKVELEKWAKERAARATSRGPSCAKKSAAENGVGEGTVFGDAAEAADQRSEIYPPDPEQ